MLKSKLFENAILREYELNLNKLTSCHELANYDWENENYIRIYDVTTEYDSTYDMDCTMFEISVNGGDKFKVDLYELQVECGKLWE